MTKIGKPNRTIENVKINKKSQRPKVKIPNSYADRGYLFVKVRIEKKSYRISLGKAGTTESENLYRLFISDYIKDKAEAVQKWTTKATFVGQSLHSTPTTEDKNGITLGDLICKFLEKNKSDYQHYRRVAQLLIDMFTGIIPAHRITRLELLRFRDTFNETPSQKTGEKPSRQYTNKTLRYVKTIFRWGSKKGLLPTAILNELDCTEPIAYNQGNRETEPRQEIADEIVRKTVPYLLPTLRTMVQIHRICGTRPVEICRMKVGDIDMNRIDGVWIFRLKEHKTARFGRVKPIVLNKAAQDLIKPFLINKTSEDYVFSPKQTIAESYENYKVKRENRRLGNDNVSDHYSERTFANAVKRAIIRANKKLPVGEKIPDWTLYQCRHRFVSEVVQDTGSIDVARALAGHKSVTTTMIYNHADLLLAIQYAKKQGNPFEEIIDETKPK